MEMGPQSFQPDKWKESRTEIIGGNIGMDFVMCERSFTASLTPIYSLFIAKKDWTSNVENAYDQYGTHYHNVHIKWL